MPHHGSLTRGVFLSTPDSGASLWTCRLRVIELADVKTPRRPSQMNSLAGPRVTFFPGREGACHPCFRFKCYRCTRSVPERFLTSRWCRQQLVRPLPSDEKSALDARPCSSLRKGAGWSILLGGRAAAQRQALGGRNHDAEHTRNPRGMGTTVA